METLINPFLSGSLGELAWLYSEMLELERSLLKRPLELHKAHRRSARNLAHYLALRRHKEATIGILSDGSFFGEGSLAGQPLRMGTATAMTDCAVLRIEKKAMVDTLHRENTLSDLFVAYLLTRNIRYEEDLVDQLFNSSEKRLARVLLMLARFGKEGIPESVIPRISQETLAEMVGTTRSRVSFFMNRFRKLGFIDYAGGPEGGLQVHSSLLNIVLHD